MNNDSMNAGHPVPDSAVELAQQCWQVDGNKADAVQTIAALIETYAAKREAALQAKCGALVVALAQWQRLGELATQDTPPHAWQPNTAHMFKMVKDAVIAGANALAQYSKSEV